MDGYVKIGTELDTKSFDAQIKQVETQLDEIEQKLKKADMGFEVGDTIKLEAQYEKLSHKLSNLRQKQTDLNRADTKKLQEEVKKVGKEVDNVGTKLNGTIKKIGKWALAVFGVRSAYMGIRRAVSIITSQNEQLKADLENITSIIASKLEPVVSWMVDMIYKLLSAVNSLTSAFFGFSLFASKGAKDLKSASGSASKIKKSLQGFDEMNVINDTSSSGGGSAGGVDPRELSNQYDKLFDNLKSKLDKLFQNKKIKGFFENIKTIALNSFVFIKDIGGTIWDNVLTSWDEVLPHLQAGFNNLSETWFMMWEDLANFTDEWYPQISETLSSFIDDIFETFRPLTTFMAQLWEDVTSIILETWKKYGEPILDEVGKFIDGLIDTFNKIWTNIIDPIISPAIKFIKKMWDDHLKEMLSEIFDFVATVALEALRFYNKFIKPIVDWLVEFLGPIFKTVFGTIFNILEATFGNIFSTINSVIKNIKGIFQGFMTFLEGVFTADWKKVWKGLVQIFENIFKGIGNIFKLPINSIIDGINTFTKGLNKIKIPDWVPVVGGKGLNISPIKKLASGGIINYPNHGIPVGGGRAIGGESGAEGVIPLTDSQAMETLGETIGKYITLNLNNEIKMDGKTIGREVKRIQGQQDFLMNR